MRSAFSIRWPSKFNVVGEFNCGKFKHCEYYGVWFISPAGEGGDSDTPNAGNLVQLGTVASSICSRIGRLRSVRKMLDPHQPKKKKVKTTKIIEPNSSAGNSQPQEAVDPPAVDTSSMGSDISHAPLIAQKTSGSSAMQLPAEQFLTCLHCQLHSECCMLLKRN